MANKEVMNAKKICKNKPKEIHICHHPAKV